ncbi:MAG: STAS domain-containing protein [Eubacterium sp.]|nr:STAS domain-containing protein [Eubacterium sp.]
MFNVEKKSEGKNVTLVLSGRLDTSTAPELDAQVTSSIEGTENLVFDFAQLDYISSAGLRVLLSALKMMSKQGSMKITNVSESVREIFDITGFSDILTIE